MDMIDLCESLSNLLKHPLAEAFLYAKWKSLRTAYFLDYVCYYIFLIFFNGLIYCEATLRSQIEGCTRLLIFKKFPPSPLLFEPPRLLIFKKISSLPVFSPTQMKNFPPSPLLLEPPRLLNLKKNSSLPFYLSLPLY